MTTPAYGDVDDFTDEGRERHLAQVEKAFQDQIDRLEAENQELRDLVGTDDDPDEDEAATPAAPVAPAAPQQPTTFQDYMKLAEAAEAEGNVGLSIAYKARATSALTAPLVEKAAHRGPIVEPTAKPDARQQLQASMAEKFAAMPKLNPDGLTYEEEK